MEWIKLIEYLIFFYALGIFIYFLPFSLKSFPAISRDNIWLLLLLSSYLYYAIFTWLYWKYGKTTLFIQLHSSYLGSLSLFGPLFYLYIRDLTQEVRLSFIDCIHFAPFALFLITYWNYYTLPLDVKISAVITNQMDQYLLTIIPNLEWLYVLIMLIYLVVSYHISQKTISKSKLAYKWVKQIHRSFAGLTACFVGYFVLVYLDIISISIDYLLTVGIISFTGFLFYFGRNFKEGVYTPKMDRNQKSSRPSPSESIQIRNCLQEIMIRDKLFLNQNLRLQDLADALDLSRNETSHLINHYFQVSFFEFVNGYRVNQAKEMLSNPQFQRYSISDIIYQCGFNNRVSFYKIFKKQVGTTPTAFRRKKALGNT